MDKLICTFIAGFTFLGCFGQRYDLWVTTYTNNNENTRFLFLPVSADSDETETAETKKQNFIYFTGSLPMLSGYYVACYEREVLTGNSGTLNLSAGYGGWSNWDNGGSVGLLSSHFISGKGRHYFESDIGLMFHNDNSNFVEIAPVKFNINAGYRIQQRGKPLIFRIGVGWPMVLYTSLGIAF